MAEYTGKQKLAFCKRLHNSWRDLAIYFDIPPNEVRAFNAGEEAGEIWDWLQVRNCLNELPDVLRYIDREDLVVDILEPIIPAAISKQSWQGSPYPGLRAFGEQDAPIFFGRRQEAQELLSQFSHERFISVIGASGSGKSSLVAAGLLPSLAEISPAAPWRCLRFTPGELNDDPFLPLAAQIAFKFPQLGLNGREIAAQLRAQGNLARLLMADNLVSSGILLFIDQFEELFTLCKEDHCRRFLEMLARAVMSEDSCVRAIITLRADAYYFCVENPRVAALLRKGSFPLAAPTLPALNDMILGPAAVAGLAFEDGLPSRLLADAGQEPGSLPLLAFTLEALYRDRTDNALTHTAYERFSGLKGVIRQRAEFVFQELQHTLGHETAEQALATVFTELVEVDPERRIPTRKRAPLGYFKESYSVRQLVEHFSDARLLVCSDANHTDANVEFAHEALLTQWPKLSNWIEERFDDFHLLRQARSDSQQWLRLGKPDSHLWRHERLNPVYDAIRRLQPKLEDEVKEFLRPEAERLLDQIKDPNTDHQTRARIGDRLAEIGDPRPGVRLNAEGLPHLVWLFVPGDVITLEENFGRFKVDPFYISKYPVTWTQYQVFLDSKDGYRDSTWWQNLKRESTPGKQYRKSPNHPAENVSWFDTVAYCRWLSEKLGYEIRLPTEWEWQQAATGGDERVYAWGYEWQNDLANTDESCLSRTTAVGLYPNGASPIGALDMTGNVWEWCLNCYNKANVAVFDDPGSRRALRGGSWGSVRIISRSSYRNSEHTNVRDRDLGFRLCCSSPIF